MDLREKIIKALLQPLKAAYIRLEEDDGISGFVVSPQFEGMSALDRQELIDDTLNKTTPPLEPEERSQVLMIAALTPTEYYAVGVRIRVHQVKERARGTVEVVLHGGPSDAEYVRAALNNRKDIQTRPPKQVTGALGVLMTFRAKGTDGTPLTKAKAIRALKNDPYIEVLPNA